MPLVDLGISDPAVPPLPVLWRSALPGSHVGLTHGEALVASATLARAGAGALEIHALAARSERDARALLDQLAGATSDATLVAPPVADEALLRRLGFVDDARRSWSRTPPPPVHPPSGSVDVVDPATAGLGDLARAIRTAWSRASSADPGEWSPGNPARGQCDVTAAIVREVAGGVILVADAVLGGRRLERHAWNRLPDGSGVDLTREQFAPGTWLTQPSPGLTRMSGFDERLAALRAALELDSSG